LDPAQLSRDRLGDYSCRVVASASRHTRCTYCAGNSASRELAETDRPLRCAPEQGKIDLSG
jgi:hypothetical protein